MSKFTKLLNFQSLKMEKKLLKVLQVRLKLQNISKNLQNYLFSNQCFHMIEISKIFFVKLQNVIFNILNRYLNLTSSIFMLFSINDLWQGHFILIL